MAGYSQQRLANYCEPKLNYHQFFFAVEWSSRVASVSPHQTCHKFLLPYLHSQWFMLLIINVLIKA
jgi:hypothetical protein